MLYGYGTLHYLRSQLLPEEMENEVTWDDDLGRIGAGVAGQFDLFCGREFARAEGATWAVDGGTSFIQVPRFPIEQVTGLELEPQGGGTNDDILALVATISKGSGIIKMTTLVGSYRERIHVTYDGGYWIDDEITPQPAGSTALPAELLDAWVMQCQAQAEHLDIFGAGAAKPGGSPERVAALSRMDLIPRVKDVLSSYRRLG